MPKSSRFSLILVLIIAGINFFFMAVALFLNAFVVSSNVWHWLIIIIASILSSASVTYLILSATPLFRNYLHTFRHLVRLESLNHPLLIKFSHDAPGTYHHTLTVANIATRAAKSIGADSLLTRVGAYYHDIGKIAAPENYVENQPPGHNKHDEIADPVKSAKMIINHVARGVELAKENHLPNEIIDFIRQHQGTTLVSYFYDQAKKLGLKIKKSDFRYPGPKPLSRETAILMLADGTEAAVRSEPELSPQDIRHIINDIIEQRIADHQLEYSGLTAANLTKIRQSFYESLTAIFHQRLRYPGQIDSASAPTAPNESHDHDQHQTNP